MKEKIILAVALLTAMAGRGQSSLPDFNSMRTPLSPAFTILGVEPTSVERPNTPSSVAFGLYNSFGNGILPQNFSMEFSPYWLIPRYSLTWKQDTLRKFCESLARTSTISLATGKYFFETDSVTGLSFGYRVQLYSGKLGPDATSALRRLEANNASDSKKIAELKNQLDSAADALWLLEIKEAQNDTAKLNAARRKHSRLVAVNDTILLRDYQLFKKQKKNKQDDSLIKIATTRTGFILEFATAGVAASHNDSWKTMHLPKYGIWLTPSYNWKTVSFVSTFRYVYSGFNPDSTKKQFYEGLRFIYAHDRYAVSAEGVVRYKGQSITNDDCRLALVLDYRIFPDTWLEVAFGKNFALPGGANLLANIGLNYNISRERYKFDE